VNPAQELFDQLMIECEDMGYTVYDHLPLESENADYPFISMGMTQLIPVSYKDALGGRIEQTLDVWGNAESRPLVVDTINKLSLLGAMAIKTKHYRFVGRPAAQDQQVITDMSVPDTVLYHGVITLVFNLS
jgi:hypothetical protein